MSRPWVAATPGMLLALAMTEVTPPKTNQITATNSARTARQNLEPKILTEVDLVAVNLYLIELSGAGNVGGGMLFWPAEFSGELDWRCSSGPPPPEFKSERPSAWASALDIFNSSQATRHRIDWLAE